MVTARLRAANPSGQRRPKMSDAQNTGDAVGEMRPTRLRDALDPLFAQVPEKVDLFDRGVSQGETPRLWIDVVAHIVMGRDKRIYRFVQDTRFGRIVLAESHDVPVIVDAVTGYVARRMIEREHAMVATPVAAEPAVEKKPRRRGFGTFVLGFVLGAVALFGLALYASLKNF